MTGDGIILWEAHRGGGGYELPESTPVGFEYAWMLGGTPEADVNATADGRLLSLHDGKLGRTAREIDEETGRTPIAELPYARVRRCDIGSDRYPEQVIPSIDELLAKLRGDVRKEIVIDYKNAPLEQLSELIARFGVAKQLTLATTDEAVAARFRQLQPEVRIKIWLGGAPGEITARFDALAAREFGGFEQVQIHLNDDPERKFWRYALPPDEVRRMKRSDCLVMISGEAPVRDKKYNLFDHPNLKYTPDYRSPRGLLHRAATPIPAPEGYTMPPDYMAQAGTVSLAYVAELTCPEITEDLYDELQEWEESLL